MDEPTQEPKKKDGRPPSKTRAGRKVEPASLNRVGKRALIFAPLMFLTIRLLEPKDAIGASILRTVFLLALFLPFSYVTDSMLYRSHVRRYPAESHKGEESQLARAWRRRGSGLRPGHGRGAGESSRRPRSRRRAARRARTSRASRCRPRTSRRPPRSDRAVDDDDERVLLHLMVAQLLARVEADQDGARLVVTSGGRPASGCRRASRSRAAASSARGDPTRPGDR